MDKGSFSAHLCAECVGDPGAEHVWDGHRYTCSAHHRWVAPGPSPKRPSTYTPHPPGEWTAHRVPPEVVEADLQIADLYSKGRITARLVEEVVRRVGSARGAEHHGVARPGDLSWVAAVLASVIDPEVQAVVLDETVPFADRYARLSTMLEARVPQRTPELCDQVWLLLRPTAVWVRSVLHGEAAVDAFEPALLPEAGLDLSAIRYPMEPFYRSMDCLRTAVRQGAASVKCLYRRDKANMPGSMREVKNAEEEGVEFVWLSAPEAFLGDDRVTGVRVQRMRLGMPDASGRQAVEPTETRITVEADLVVKALGFDPEELPALWEQPGLEVSRWGTLKVNHRTAMTSLPGVFAAGDIVRGASLVVWAIRDGRDAAAQMHAHLQKQAAPVAVAAE